MTLFKRKRKYSQISYAVILNFNSEKDGIDITYRKSKFCNRQGSQ